MPQLHLYLPEADAEKLKKRASASGLPISKYLAKVVVESGEGEPGWPDDFFTKTIGGWVGKPVVRYQEVREQKPTLNSPAPHLRNAGGRLLHLDSCLALLTRPSDSAIDHLRSRPPRSFFVSTLVIGELLYSARLSSDASANFDRATRFVEPLTRVDFNERSALLYSELAAESRRLKSALTSFDLMIAATAKANSLVIATTNPGRYSHLIGVKVESIR